MKTLFSLTFVLVLSATVSAAEPVDYTRDVKPLFAKNCVMCHGPDKQKSGLRLDTAANMRKGGDSGPAIDPGASDTSRVILASRRGCDAVAAMPPKGEPLSRHHGAISAR